MSAQTGQRDTPKQQAAPVSPSKRRPRFWIFQFYGSAIGKKYLMAVTGIVLLGYVLLHMVGNLKLYLGPEHFNEYAEWLRIFGAPAVPDTSFLWIMRVVLLVSFVIHIHAAFALWRMNRRARPVNYQSKRDYVAADFAARTMRWTGIIVLLFVLFHLADLTTGHANPVFDQHDPFGNLVGSFQRAPVAGFYIIANLALGLHLYHGAWSLFQTLGVNNPRFNHWRRYFAIAFAVVVTAGNVSFPLAVQTGLVG